MAQLNSAEVLKYINVAEELRRLSVNTPGSGCLILSNDLRIVGSGYNETPEWFDERVLSILSQEEVDRIVFNAVHMALTSVSTETVSEERLSLLLTEPPSKIDAIKICNCDLDIRSVYYLDKNKKKDDFNLDNEEMIDVFSDFNIQVYPIVFVKYS